MFEAERRFAPTTVRISRNTVRNGLEQVSELIGIRTWCQESSNSVSPLVQRSRVDQSFKATWSVPLDYQTNALRLILTEANSVAQELDLPERLPITESDVTAKYIPAPRMARMLKTVGNITTSNYTYYCSVGYKFSFLTKKRLRQTICELAAAVFVADKQSGYKRSLRSSQNMVVQNIHGCWSIGSKLRCSLRFLQTGWPSRRGFCAGILGLLGKAWGRWSRKCSLCRTIAADRVNFAVKSGKVRIYFAAGAAYYELISIIIRLKRIEYQLVM
jgi:hypothetical protein